MLHVSAFVNCNKDRNESNEQPAKSPVSNSDCDSASSEWNKITDEKANAANCSKNTNRISVLHLTARSSRSRSRAPATKRQRESNQHENARNETNLHNAND